MSNPFKFISPLIYSLFFSISFLGFPCIVNASETVDGTSLGKAYAMVLFHNGDNVGTKVSPLVNGEASATVGILQVGLPTLTVTPENYGERRIRGGKNATLSFPYFYIRLEADGQTTKLADGIIILNKDGDKGALSFYEDPFSHKVVMNTIFDKNAEYVVKLEQCHMDEESDDTKSQSMEACKSDLLKD